MVSVITGVSVPEVNIPRLPAVEDVLLVSQKRNKYYENKTLLLEKNVDHVRLIIAGFITYFGFCNDAVVFEYFIKEMRIPILNC